MQVARQWFPKRGLSFTLNCHTSGDVKPKTMEGLEELITDYLRARFPSAFVEVKRDQTKRIGINAIAGFDHIHTASDS